ncbi:unnamed protein product [Cunninghamella blakesleeana]
MVTLPKSAYLQKMTTIMGKTIWQTRYFVLLETELRYYKDEHEAVPNNIISLRDIYSMKEMPMIHQRYCLSLEPNLGSKRSKSLILGFTEKIELEAWMDAIQSRLNKIISFSTTTLTSAIDLSALNENEEEDDDLLLSTHTKSSLTRRRGIILSELEIQQIPNLISSMSTPSSTNSSPSSTHFSFHKENKENDDDHLSTSTTTSTSPSTIHSLMDYQHHNNSKEDGEHSPTFLQYSSQFHLAMD